MGRNQMARADGPLDARQREVEALARARRLLGGGFRRGAALFDDSLNVRAQVVERLPDGALELWRGGLQPVVGDLRQHAGLAPQPSVAERFPARFVARRVCVADEFRSEVGEERSHLRRLGDAKLREGLRDAIRFRGHRVFARKGAAGSCERPYRPRERRRLHHLLSF